MKPQEANAAQASHPSRIRTWFPALPAPRSGATIALARQRSKGVPHLPKLVADSSLRRTCDRYGGQRPCLAPRSKGGGGRNARATSRAYARFAGISPGNSPSRITGCRWLCRNHSAKSETLTFHWTHSQPDCCAGQHKKVTPLCRSCGGRDFPVEDRGKLRTNISPQIPLAIPFNNLHTVKQFRSCRDSRLGCPVKAKPSSPPTGTAPSTVPPQVHPQSPRTTRNPEMNPPQ
jgi:hypothetical protein